jgi:hypothetical protein
MTMTYKIFGADCAWCQRKNIVKGLETFGFIEGDGPKFIYANDPGGYDEALNYKLNFAIKPKLIYNIQDIPIHLKDFNIKGLIEKLRCADAITTISEYTKDSVKRYCGYDSTVIYQPINNIYKLDQEIDIKYKSKLLIIGRFRDPNKRTMLVLQAFRDLGVKPEEITAVGPDAGAIIDEPALNCFYNGAEYVACAGKIEELNLVICEALAAGAIPIVLSDCSTREEFLPQKYFPEYAEIGNNSIDIAAFVSKLENNSAIKNEFKDRLYFHYKTNLEEKFKPTSVAKKIIETYWYS